MDRRKFLRNVSAAIAGTAMAGSMTDLVHSSSAQASARASANEIDATQVPINLTDTPELAQVGGTYHLEYDDLQRDILVVHVAPEQYVAVDLKCTHRGCDVSYSPDEKNFYCPCHGSKFDKYGHVLTGPATMPLTYYHTERNGDEVMVTVFGPNDKVPTNCIAPAADTTSQIKLDSTAQH